MKKVAFLFLIMAIVSGNLLLAQNKVKGGYRKMTEYSYRYKFVDAYPDSEFKTINNENFFEFLTDINQNKEIQ